MAQQLPSSVDESVDEWTKRALELFVGGDDPHTMALARAFGALTAVHSKGADPKHIQLALTNFKDGVSRSRQIDQANKCDVMHDILGGLYFTLNELTAERNRVKETGEISTQTEEEPAQPLPEPSLSSENSNSELPSNSKIDHQHTTLSGGGGEITTKTEEEPTQHLLEPSLSSENWPNGLPSNSNIGHQHNSLSGRGGEMVIQPKEIGHQHNSLSGRGGEMVIQPKEESTQYLLEPLFSSDGLFDELSFATKTEDISELPWETVVMGGEGEEEAAEGGRSTPKESTQSLPEPSLSSANSLDELPSNAITEERSEQPSETVVMGGKGKKKAPKRGRATPNNKKKSCTTAATGESERRKRVPRSANKPPRYTESADESDGEEEPPKKKSRTEKSEKRKSSTMVVARKRDGSAHKRDVSMQGLENEKGTPQCVVDGCDIYPSTAMGYIGHLSRSHKTTLNVNGIYLLCECGQKLTSQGFAFGHFKKCDKLSFTLHKLDEE